MSRLAPTDAIPEPESFNGEDLRPLPSVGSGGGVSHRCLECDWRGPGETAYAHHKVDHHRIVIVALAHLGPVAFSCCANRHEAGLTEEDVERLAARSAR